MRKKIIGVLVFFMLTVPVISAVGMYNTNDTKEEVDAQNIEEDLTIVIYKAPGFFGVNLDITNEGTTTQNNVEWSFRTKAAMEAILQDKIIDLVSISKPTIIEPDLPNKLQESQDESNCIDCRECLSKERFAKMMLSCTQIDE